MNDQTKNMLFDNVDKDKLNLIKVRLHLNLSLFYLESDLKNNNALNQNQKFYEWFNKGYLHFFQEKEKMEADLGVINSSNKSYTKLLRPIIS